MWPLLNALLWKMEWMQRGKAPETKHTGEKWEGTNCVLDPGSDLAFSTVLFYVKGDLAESSHSLGLQSWKSALSPCCFCSMPLDDVFDEHNGGVDAWPLKLHDDYDKACKQCEIEVQLATPDDVLRLVNNLSWQKHQYNIGGRVVICEVMISGKQLLPGDRLEPNGHLWDIGALEKIQLPSQVIMWRPRLTEEAQPRVKDAMHHRNPLFSRSLFSSPHNTLCVDILHSVYRGPVMRFCGAAVQRILLKNLNGSFQAKKENGVAHLKASMDVYFDRSSVPHNRRLNNITLAMCGKAFKFSASVRPCCLLSHASDSVCGWT